ncbi:Cytochrome C biogenesis protein transmembrane region [Streptosporangium subroseum]|uniref:Cytochrome C biogenesis protein transmembrane region n=1 Tax=Streptosporangium subroseum TaxID=106412 RepID=A0A239M6B0_9ACTN|nr:sulfite exporter TauE/SafE family protein [Streptosporangium subroseum]SNT38265.1 Cytochrome C biogenesis protein transmembrane region [Streptosporangium subroseum]
MLRGDLDRNSGRPLSAGLAALFAGGLAAGLVAGTASCTAMQGGLLAGLTSRENPVCGGDRPMVREPSGPAVVSLFLAGRSGSHVVAGALLGLVGSAVQLGPEVRAALLVVAGIAVMVFGARMFRREPVGCAPHRTVASRAAAFGGKVIALRATVFGGRTIASQATVPEGGTLPSGNGPAVSGDERLTSGSGPAISGNGTITSGTGPAASGSGTITSGNGPAASGSGTLVSRTEPTASGERALTFGGGVVAPGVRAVMLGAATILLPCGVTLSTEVVAVSSGSALGGAAVMAGFAVGTAPAFALLGLALRRVATTRLAALAGIVALATGLWTIASGMSLGGWLPGSGGSPAAAATVRADGTQRIDVWATDRGYRPGVVTARAGVSAEIVFHLVGAPGCTRMLTIDGRDVALPATVRLDPRPPGSLRYVCSMGMYVGFITFL